MTNDDGLEDRVPRSCVLLQLRINSAAPIASIKGASRATPPPPAAKSASATGSGTLRALREALLGARYTQDLVSTLNTFTGSLPHAKAAPVAAPVAVQSSPPQVRAVLASRLATHVYLTS